MQRKKNTKKNSKLKNKKYLQRKRLAKQNFVLGVFLVLLFGLFINMAYINVVYGDDYERRAIRQQVNHNGVDRPINPNRGSIVDRNGQVLAASITVYNIILDVRQLFTRSLEVQQHTVDTLYDILGIPKERVWGYLEENPETGRPVRDTHYLVLERKVSRDLTNQLLSHRPLGIWEEEDTLRTYTHGALAGPVIGFTRGDNSSWGLERKYNEVLTGVPGRMVRMFDGNGNAFTQEFRPKAGYTIVTTLDLNMQQFALEAAQVYGAVHNAQRASVLIMNPNTGEILAMAQYPSFDPNDPFNIELINSQRVKEELQQVPDDLLMENLFGIWSNHTITHSFEPGSIFKPIIAAAALEEGVVTADEIFFCRGRKVIAGEVIPCWLTSGHGYLTLSQAMAVSCNTVMMELGERLGRQRFYNYQRDFGVGQITGIDLHGEASVAALTYSLNQLNPVEIATSSMGQGFNMTPIQAINSFAAVINGGHLLRPYIVSEVKDSQGNLVIENTPVVKRRVISQETSDFWREEMVHTLSDFGTGSNARIEGYAIGGKTGTAQQGDRSDEYTLSFISYLPIDDPQYLILVVIDRPTPFIQGVSTPQPMSREVMQNIIRYKAIPPIGSSSASDFGIDNRTVLIEDYTGRTLNETINRLHTKNLRFDVMGNGHIIQSQQPLPGSRVSTGSTVFLYLSDDDEGGELTIIPSVEGMTLTQATQVIEQHNLRFTIIESEEGSNQDTMGENLSNNHGPIIEQQMPAAGINVSEGTEISLILR